MPAESPEVSEPVEREVPVPNFYRQAEARGTRSESGAPGAAYWRNRVSYQIEAELEPDDALIRGVERIVYRNNSPDVLRSVVLNLYQNVFSAVVPRNRFAPVTGGVTLGRVAAQGQELERRTANEIPVLGEVATAPAGYAVQGTLARIRLPRPIAPGDSATLEIEWQHRIPPATGFRTAWEEALGSTAFLVAQWYPQVAVYDDLHGWDATPYLGDGEFYLTYGDFEVAITVPTGYLVGATGELVNPGDVLTEEAQRRLAIALAADSTTRVVTAADLSAVNATQQALGDQLTWRFTATDVRDFAFATSPGYVWDATRATIPDGAGGTRSVVVHSLYRPGAPNWEAAATYSQHSIRFLSEALVPYPYPQITVAEGPIGGMEYPMITFIPKPSSATALYAVIAHENAHEWFPMLIGQDEAAYAWMDEGAATYLEALAVGDYYDVPDPHEVDRGGYLSVAGSDVEVPLMRHTDLISPYGARVVAAYFKPSTLLRSLSAVMGEEIFREALNGYATEWANRHPTPWDFFRTMERFAVTDLGWFFHPWWFETGVLDHGIASVDAGSEGVTTVRVESFGEAVAPAIVVGLTAGGATVTDTVPASTWIAGATTGTATLRSDQPLVRVELDPARIYPDVNPENDRWEPSGTR